VWVWVCVRVCVCACVCVRKSAHYSTCHALNKEGRLLARTFAVHPSTYNSHTHLPTSVR